MKRAEAIKKLGLIYGIEVNSEDLKRVGIIHENVQTNKLYAQTIHTYEFLRYILYKNGARLKDVKDIYIKDNTIYYDLDFMKGFELTFLDKKL